MGVTTLSQSSDLAPSRKARTLSKSDYKLARTCAAKLYFRENGYPDNRDSDPYLAMLAQGGYMVEALAKAHYPAGIQLEYGRDLAADVQATVDALKRETVTLFEATLVAGRRQARVDILDKRGTTVRLLEVKAKSFDGAEHRARVEQGKPGVFRAQRKPFGVTSDWRDYIEDVTYQMLLLERTLPGVAITPHLVLVDKSKTAQLDNVPGFFELVMSPARDGTTRVQTARYLGDTEQLEFLDIVTEVDVSEEVALLRDEVEEAAAILEAALDAPLHLFVNSVQRGSTCTSCEFRKPPSEVPNGFSDCWGALAHASPHMLELYSVGKAKAPDGDALIPWMLARGTAALLDIPLDGLVQKDDNPGGVAARQRRQIVQTRLGQVYVARELRANIEALGGPMNFIDFETSRLALPYHRGMRPYGLVTFQWSAHRVPSFGESPSHAEWLNTVDVWPNQSFAESLRAAIGDEGAVLTWSPFEKSTLRDIICDFGKFGRDEPELVAWMTDVFERRMVDMHVWACRYYYHPGMRGRTSIKVVLDALWRTDEVMRQQFETWTGLPADAESDPYLALPSIEINGIPQDVHEGTGAMRAYQEMMYGASRHDEAVKAQWGALLRQYCGLDTLSMVLILEHWRRAVAS